MAYREPVELYKERDYMVMFARPSDQLGSSVLNGLKSGDVTVWQSGQDAVAVVRDDTREWTMVLVAARTIYRLWRYGA